VCVTEIKITSMIANVPTNKNKTDHISHQTNRFLQGGKLSSLQELLKPDG
jgi:hypothetical protein